MAIFEDRQQAGRILAARLQSYAYDSDVSVLALPRGGVPVGYEVAKALHAPLDVFVVRKLGVPGHEELAMGAIARGPDGYPPNTVQVLNAETVKAFGVSEAAIDAVLHTEQTELSRRERLYRANAEPLSLRGRKVIVVDDGLATGSTMRVAVHAVRQHDPLRIIVGVPISEPGACNALTAFADEVVCALTPEPFNSVGEWYQDFNQTTDDEVQQLLAQAVREHSPEYYKAALAGASRW